MQASVEPQETLALQVAASCIVAEVDSISWLPFSESVQVPLEAEDPSDRAVSTAFKVLLHVCLFTP
jgi:hypothetical protein